MLSGKELFCHRYSREKTVPQKGGLKDFMPDGSWLQNKRLEKFHEERQNVLTEPRVQRKCDWVKGEWKPRKKLVELHQHMRNFFDHMGFTGGNRKWLYPEEALFLMEMSILELWYQKLPLSIQQAFQMLLCDARSVELYQVYSHLRRVGYIVLHHRGRLNVTKYERKIGLDQYTNKSIKKSKHLQHRGEDKSSTEGRLNLSVDSDTVEEDSDSPRKSTDDSMKDTELDDLHDSMSDQGEDGSDGLNDEPGEMCEDRVVQDGQDASNTQVISALDSTTISDNTTVEGEEQQTMQKDQEKDIKLECSQGSSKERKVVDEENCDVPPSESEDRAGSKACFSRKDMSMFCSRKLSQWDFKETVFPNFSSDKDIIVIPSPDLSKFPVGVKELDKSNYQFEKKKFINTKRVKRNREDVEEEELRFSYSDIVTGKSHAAKSARNWKEYKLQIEQDLASLDCRKVVPHLYSDDLEPLVKPELAVSTTKISLGGRKLVVPGYLHLTGAVLEQLHMVKEEAVSTGKCPSPPSLSPDFDVYAPNMQFKKSSPGVPDHRVCVVRCSDPPPELSTINAISSYLNDEASLHWAVVDNGDIAFYAMSEFRLPQDINMG